MQAGKPGIVPTRVPRACLELGVCQSRRPACRACTAPAPCPPGALAPGVLDGPYRRQTTMDRAQEEAATALQSAKDALRQVAAYLMGPRP